MGGALPDITRLASLRQRETGRSGGLTLANIAGSAVRHINSQQDVPAEPWAARVGQSFDDGASLTLAIVS